jgi:hypothetical protein
MNPTREDLSAALATILSDNTPSSGSCTDEEMGDTLTALIVYFNTIDPDKTPIIKQLVYE